MHWISGFFNTLILLGALQGFIVSVLLYRSGRAQRSPSPSKRLLAVLIFLMALACLDIFLQDWMIVTTIGAIVSAIIPFIIIMPVGPLIFFYVRSCIDPEFRIGRKQRFHFYTIFIDLFQHVAALFYIIGIVTGLIRNNVYHFGDFMDTYNVYADIPRWLSMAIYLGLSLRSMALAGKQGKKTAWPKRFVRLFIIFGVIWLIFLIPYEIPRYSNALIDTFDWYPIYLPLVFMIYWLGVKGYFISYQDIPGNPEKRSPSRTPLQEHAADQMILVLKKCMEEDRVWLNPELNLRILSQHSKIASKNISMVLNQHMHKTFNEFVNEYRVSEVKKRLLRPESKALTIAGLAYECGFNSLPTFQRAFKAILGLSPKEFLSRNATPGQSSPDDLSGKKSGK